MLKTPTLTELYAPVAPELDAVRGQLAELWAETLQFVDGVDVDARPPGGKLMRPALCLLSAGAIGAKPVRNYVPMAAAMELLHLAALAHDDVIDDADTRRGQRSLRARWDNHTAVLGGDYLVARAIGLLAGFNRTSVVVNAVESVRQMAEGELIHFGRGPDGSSIESCIHLAKKKTASLFAVTCSTPTCIVHPEYRDALYAYGMGLGIAFQVADDILDLVQDAHTLGKPSCGDLVEGKHTVPILYLRESAGANALRRLDAMRGADITDDDRAWVHELMESTGARERAEELSQGYINEALNALDVLPLSPFRQSMEILAEFVIHRSA